MHHTASFHIVQGAIKCPLMDSHTFMWKADNVEKMWATWSNVMAINIINEDDLKHKRIIFVFSLPFFAIRLQRLHGLSDNLKGICISQFFYNT